MLIEQSIAKQYHILPSAQGELKYSDWAKMVSGLMDDTPLGRIVEIRSETNTDLLKYFTKEQKEIRSEWASFIASKSSAKQSIEEDFKQLEKMLASMFGG